MKTEQQAQPPQPPPFERKIQLGWLQVVGVSLLAALPLIAFTGALGIREEQAEDESQALAIQVTYANPTHYKTTRPVEIRITNRGEQELPSVIVRLDNAYLSAFAMLHSAPEISRITDQDHEVEIGGLLPRQTRRVVLQLEPERYGRHRGRISAGPAEGPAVEVVLSTLVLP